MIPVDCCQIEGVVADYGLGLGDLIGIISEFFARVGVLLSVLSSLFVDRRFL